MNFSLLCINGKSKKEIKSSVKALLNGNSVDSSVNTESGEYLTLSIVAENSSDLYSKLELALELLTQNNSINDPSGIYFESAPFGDQSVAFLFPGQGSQYSKMLSPMCSILPGFKEKLDEIFSSWNSIDNRNMKQMIYADESIDAEARLKNTLNGQPAIGIVSDAISATLINTGIKPGFFAGHSFGELSALKAAKVLSRDSFLYLSRERGRLLAEAGEKVSGCMTAVMESPEKILPLFSNIHGVIEIANYNTPFQTVVTGETSAVSIFEKSCEINNIRTVRLKTSCAFHSSLMSPVTNEWKTILKKAKLNNSKQGCQEKVYSNYTSKPYTNDDKSLIENLYNQVENSVNWDKICKNMYKSGARIFLETGPGSVLTGLSKKIFGNKPHFSSSCDLKDKKQLIHLLAKLAAHNVKFNWKVFCDHSLLNRKKFNQTGATMASNSVTISNDRGNSSAAAYFEGNSNVVQSFFNIQETLLEKIDSTLEPEDFSSMIDSIMEKNINVMDNFMQAQNHGISHFSNGIVDTEQPRKLPEARPVYEITPSSANNVEEPKNNIIDGIISWTRSEICSTTGFPVEIVKPDATFNNDLGIDSITLMQIFMGIVKEFPEVEKIGDGLRSASSLSSLYNILSESKFFSDAPEVVKTEADAGKIDEIIKRSKEVIIDTTGFPDEMITMDAEFSSQLGIDSITVIQIFLKIINEFPEIEEIGEQLREASSLEAIGLTIEKSGIYSTKQHTEKKPGPVKIERFVIVEDDAISTSDSETPELPEQMILAGAPGSHYEKFKEYIRNNNCDVIELQVVQKEGHFGWDLKDKSDSSFYRFDQGKELNQALKKHSTEGIIPPVLIVDYNEENLLESDSFTKWENGIEISATSIFVLAKSLIGEIKESELKGDLFACINCGKNYPSMRSSAGVIKSLSKEWPGVNVKYARLKNPEDIKSLNNVFTEILKTGDTGKEVIVDTGSVSRISYSSELLNKINDEEININADSVLLLTGGGDGITSELGYKLAEKYKCHIVSLGRTKLSEKNSPYIHITDEAELKKNIFTELKQNSESVNAATVMQRFKNIKRQQAILRNENRITDAGGKFSYFSADVTNKEELKEALKKIKNVAGQINGFIHGAGIIEDKLVSAKSVSSFNNVLNTKAHSIYHLYHLLKNEPLEFAVLLSSITSFTGTVGQTDYAAANEILNGTAAYWNENADYPVKSMLWSVWSDTGLAGDSLINEMEKSGLGTISTKEGVELFMDELTMGTDSESIVMFSPLATLDFLNNSTGIQEMLSNE